MLVTASKNIDIDPGFYDYNPEYAWNTMATTDKIASKNDVAVLEQKIEELQKKIEELMGPCYCESLL